MRVSCRRLRLRVSQQTANDGKSEAHPGADRCEHMAKVMQANTFQRGMLANCRPRLLEVGARLVDVLAGDDIGAELGMAFQNVDRRLVQHDGLAARLRVWEQQESSFEIDVLPFEI